jgi:molecular chaperone DnaK (HSP70)
MTNGPFIGIDLGTTSCRFAIFKNGKIESIPDENGNRNTPCCVAFTNNGILVGDAAVHQASLNPENTVFGK